MKQNKGVTLIALVITIVVLLILAGVALNVVLDPTNIIGKAEEAKTKVGLQTEKENIELATLFAMDMPEGKTNTALLEEQLSNVEGLNITKGTEIWTITSEKTGAIYEVNIGTGKILNEIAEDVAVDENPGTLETVGTNTYEINSIEDLVALAYNVNSGTKYSGATVTLGRNLYFDGSFNSYAEPEAKYELDGTKGYKKVETSETTLKSLLTTGIGFVPIDQFQGNFDGNGKYLNGLYINSNGFGGLFGNIVTGVTISNLGIKNGNISGNSPSGGIIGNAVNVTITNCYSTAKILGKAPTGGIIGYATNATITNCYNAGNISTISSPTGGIIGYGYGTITITDCYNTGDIFSEMTPASGIMAAGSGTIMNCYNTGDISSIASTAGGIVASEGGSTATIINCYNTGKISSQKAAVGGIVANGSANITNCYNTGNVSTIEAMAGGIMSQGTGTITNCYNTGNITSGSFENSHVGGIMGEPSSTTSITKCYNAGTLTSGIDSTGNIYAEGTATVTDCGERTINDFLTIFNAYVTTNNSDATKTELKSWTIKDGDLYFEL